MLRIPRPDEPSSFLRSMFVCVITSYSIHYTKLYEELQGGSMGTYYEQTFEISGGTLPYTTIEVTANLPEGLTFDMDTLTLSGTPTSGGFGELSLSVTDPDGISATKDYSLKIMADGDFTFTSSNRITSYNVCYTKLLRCANPGISVIERESLSVNPE